MACLTVTVTGIGIGEDPVTAIDSAIDDARDLSKAICAKSGGDCTGMDSTPESIEVLEEGWFADDPGKPTILTFDADVKCTFRCQRKKGCSPFARRHESEAAVDVDYERLKKRATRAKRKPQDS